MPRPTDNDGSIFEQLRPRLTAISARIVGSEAEAQDVVQDCYLKWHATEQAALAVPAAWLTTVVQRQSIDRLRKRSRDAVAALGAMELVPAQGPATPEEGVLARDELGEALARMLVRLSSSERLALVLHEVLDCGHDDIAAALGTKPVNARQYLARARRRLRDSESEAAGSDKLCRELVRRFQAAINDLDVPAMMSLLADEQPVSVCTPLRLPVHDRACANDAAYAAVMAWAA